MARVCPAPCGARPEQDGALGPRPKCLSAPLPCSRGGVWKGMGRGFEKRFGTRSGHIISEVPSSFKVLYNMISSWWSALKGSKNQRKVNSLAKYKEKMSGKTKRKPSTQPGGRDTGKTSLGKTLLS